MGGRVGAIPEYRVLDGAQEVRERRNQRRHPVYRKPELLATAPNQVWSWDITKLLGPVKWAYFQLTVILDIFSRYVVGRQVLLEAYAKHPQRFVRQPPEPPALPEAVWINPPSATPKPDGPLH